MFNYVTQKFEEADFSGDLKKYLPVDYAAYGMYDSCIKMGQEPRAALKEVLQAVCGFKGK